MSSYDSKAYRDFSKLIDNRIENLFNELSNNLSPMDKFAMSGRCELETIQMQHFLRENFGFENIPNEYIVQGVKSFRIEKSLSNFDPNLPTIQFPNRNSDNIFEMTINELIQWQRTYSVYALKDSDLAIGPLFLQQALQGRSQSGEEAFRMKFVCRISTCPILMEFDAKIIRRKLDENWPHRIKLVSVTGIDFAGRIHDIDDIRTYISNWQDVFFTDPSTDLPIVANGRDFMAKRGSSAHLNETRLWNDLIRMIYLRLYAYDQEHIEIVVETGIGLGVFAGKQIGIDQQIRTLSAKAMKYVLENYVSNLKHIRAIIFALPIFETDKKTSTYYSFIQVFNEGYKGIIPILIIDQDMHRLTVHIAKKGFQVSELNPADSHGVFGEYWQNFGPAVEEKLALTTLGLIIQHHLINGDNVLNTNNYKFIDQPHNCGSTSIVIPENSSALVIHRTLLQTVFGSLRNLVPSFVSNFFSKFF